MCSSKIACVCLLEMTKTRTLEKAALKREVDEQNAECQDRVRFGANDEQKANLPKLFRIMATSESLL